MLRIVIVGQDPESIHFLKSELESRGCRIAQLPQADSLPQFCAQHAPDMGIIDFDGLRGDLWEILEKTRQATAKPTPLLGISTGDVESLAQAVKNRGVGEVISKPFSSESLASGVRMVLQPDAPAPGQSAPVLRTVSPPAGVEGPGPGGPMGALWQMMAEIRSIVEWLQPQASEFGEEGPELFGYIISSSRQIVDRLVEIKADPATVDHALYDKGTRHDFRNMIGSVTGFSELILMEPGIPIDAQRGFKRIRQLSASFVSVLDEQKAQAA